MSYDTIPNYVLYIIVGLIKSILGLIIVVSVILNFSSAIIGGIWLAILGNWGIILFGLIISFLMPFAYSILIMPGLGIAAIIEHYHGRGNRPLMAIFGFLSSAYGYAILAMWILGVFIYFTNRAIISSGYALLFWSHAIMIGPLTYMASKEPPESHGTTMGLFFAQLSFIIFVIFFFLHLSLSSFIYSIAILGGVFSILQTIMAMVESSQDDRTFQDMPEFNREENTDSISLADDYMADGEFDRAIEIYRFTLENDPENEMILANLGYCYSQNGDYRSALGYFDMALKLDQFDSYNWYFKGICLYNLQDYENALSSYKTAIELEPDLPVLWYNRAITEDVLELYDDAINSFRQFLELELKGGSDRVEYANQRINELRNCN